MLFFIYFHYRKEISTCITYFICCFNIYFRNYSLETIYYNSYKTIYISSVIKLFKGNMYKYRMVSKVHDVKKEKIDNKNYWIAIDKEGNELERISTRGSNLRTHQEAKDRYKERGTLDPNKRIERTRLTNLTEVIVYGGNIPRSQINKGYKVQYVAEAVFTDSETGQKITLYGRSQGLGEAFAQTPAQAKEEAIANVYKQMSEYFGRGYDADEGKKIADTLDSLTISEGWIYYEPNRAEN